MHFVYIDDSTLERCYHWSYVLHSNNQMHLDKDKEDSGPNKAHIVQDTVKLCPIWASLKQIYVLWIRNID